MFSANNNQNDYQDQQAIAASVSPAPTIGRAMVSMDSGGGSDTSPPLTGSSVSPTENTEEPTVDPQPAANVLTPSPSSLPAGDDNLLGLKQQALQQLSPLIGHLEQPPEEKFKTTMMMIQASDDPSLINMAYDAAQQIPDDKLRAQALLDIVNEINYFTQPKPTT